MRTHEFLVRTSAFDCSRPKASVINTRCFGEDFASWLRTEMNGRNWKTSEPVQEDWGWCVLVNLDDHAFVVSVGVTEDTMGRTPADWRVGVSYDRGVNALRHLFRRPDNTKLDQISSVLEAAILADPRMQLVSSNRA